MVSFTVRMRFRPESRAEIGAALRELTLASRQEPGCVSYVAHTLESDPDTVVIYEQYRDAAALDAHRHTPHFQRLADGVLYRHVVERAVENLQALV